MPREGAIPALQDAAGPPRCRCARGPMLRSPPARIPTAPPAVSQSSARLVAKCSLPWCRILCLPALDLLLPACLGASTWQPALGHTDSTPRFGIIQKPAEACSFPFVDEDAHRDRPLAVRCSAARATSIQQPPPPGLTTQPVAFPSICPSVHTAAFHLCPVLSEHCGLLELHHLSESSSPVTFTGRQPPKGRRSVQDL